MLDYYEKRQREYEAVYAKPERQEDLAWLETEVLRQVSGRRVLELACGTGYWTRRICRTARSVHATDASAQLTASAFANCGGGDVTSGVLDAYAVPENVDYECIVAGFFFSHVPADDRERFVAGIANTVMPGCRLVLFDNRYVEGSSTPIARRAVTGDTYQLRELSDGSTHEVLKNFPAPSEVADALSGYFGRVSIQESRYYWLASGVLSG